MTDEEISVSFVPADSAGRPAAVQDTATYRLSAYPLETPPSPPPWDGSMRYVSIAASTDDAEQAGASMDYTSTDLELIREDADQLVGMRFLLDAPPNVAIASA